MLSINNVNLVGKRVLIRSDFNVPIDKLGNITSDFRILSSLPTIYYALKNGASRVIVCSHLGNPSENEFNSEKYSLYPIVKYLEKKMKLCIHFEKKYLDSDIETNCKLVLLENVRFNTGEKDNDVSLSKKYADLCDVFVMDAFASSHRMHSSVCGVMKFASVSCAGLLLIKELEALSKIINNPIRPVVAIIGGFKVSTKLIFIDSLLKIVDYLIIGGGLANTFIVAKGYDIGVSFYEKDMLDSAKYLLKDNKNIIFPFDFCVISHSENGIYLRSLDAIKFNESIKDIGNLSIKYFQSIIKQARTILWNGPMGVFENINFRKGTEMIAKFIACSRSFSVIGGGETIYSAEMFGILNKVSYISTGGGAFIKFVSREKLCALEILHSIY